VSCSGTAVSTAILIMKIAFLGALRKTTGDS
jgi:hypothetical protein